MLASRHDDDDDDDACLSPREFEGSIEVRKSEEEVFSPAEEDHHDHHQW